MKIKRLKQVQFHLDAAYLMPNAVQGQHPLCVCGGSFDNFNVFNILVAYSTHIETGMGHSLKKVFEASQDVTSLNADEMHRLIDLGAREAVAMRERRGEELQQATSGVCDDGDGERTERV